MDRAFDIPYQLEYDIQEIATRAQRSVRLPPVRQADVIDRIKHLLKDRDAVLVAHYYVDEQLQRLTDETGGHVADSLGMAAFGNTHPAKTLVVIGVRFMGETAKILNPEKTVLMPDLNANCSLDIGCPADEFATYCQEHPDRTVVVYANTSAAVKALADWMVTSSNAVDIVNFLKQRGEKIIFAPDRHLGRYIQQQTGADMLCWQGSCVVHDEFKADGLKLLKQKHPDAQVLVHPESPEEVVALADVVGSTTRLIKTARESHSDTLIVATDLGIFHKMHEAAPDKKLIIAPTGGISPTCYMCAHCPWMAMNSLENLAAVLESGGNKIHMPEDIRRKALVSIQRMLDFSQQQGLIGAVKKTG